METLRCFSLSFGCPALRARSAPEDPGVVREGVLVHPSGACSVRGSELKNNILNQDAWTMGQKHHQSRQPCRALSQHDSGLGVSPSAFHSACLTHSYRKWLQTRCVARCSPTMPNSVHSLYCTSTRRNFSCTVLFEFFTQLFACQVNSMCVWVCVRVRGLVIQLVCTTGSWM